MEEDIFALESVGGGVQQVTEEHLTLSSRLIDSAPSSPLSVLGVILLVLQDSLETVIRIEMGLKESTACDDFLTALSVSRLYFGHGLREKTADIPTLAVLHAFPDLPHQ